MATTLSHVRHAYASAKWKVRTRTSTLADRRLVRVIRPVINEYDRVRFGALLLGKHGVTMDNTALLRAQTAIAQRAVDLYDTL